MTSNENPTYEPPAWTTEKYKNVLDTRRKGFYHMDDTRDETMVAVKNLINTPTDKMITLQEHSGMFGALNMGEVMTQLKMWKKLGCRILRCNIWERSFGKYGEATMFVVQPKELDDDVPMSKIAMAFGKLVSGYAYVSKDKNLVEVCWRYLGSHE